MTPVPKPASSHQFLGDPFAAAQQLLADLAIIDPDSDQLLTLAEAAVDLRDTAALYGLDLASPLVAAAWRELVTTVTAIYGPIPVTPYVLQPVQKRHV